MLTWLLACLAPIAGVAAAGDSPAPTVKVWEEKITLPTYLAGEPEPNPMFFFGRQSQGAQGPVYPYPMYDTLTGKKVDKTYTAVTRRPWSPGEGPHPPRNPPRAAAVPWA